MHWFIANGQKQIHVRPKGDYANNAHVTKNHLYSVRSLRAKHSETEESKQSETFTIRMHK